MQPPGGAGPSPLPGRIDLGLAVGDVLVLGGASGSGKTTLLRCLALLDADGTGSVRFRGDEVADAEVPAFRRRVVFVAQTPPRFSLTVGESIGRAFELRSAPGPVPAQRATDLAARLLLPDDVMERRLKDLSAGESSRVALLRALLVDPDVLLLDEPTGALDAEARDAVASLLRDWLASAPRAALIVSHDEAFASAVATRRATLKDCALVEVPA